MSDLHIGHVEPCAFFQVGDERCAVLRLDVFYLLIEDNLGRFMLAAVPELEAPSHADHDDVGDEQQVPSQAVGFEAQRVDYRHGDDEEHIVHLAHRYGLRTVTDHTEDGEQTEYKACLDVENLHQPQQQEHAAGEQHKLHIIVAAAAVTEIHTIEQNPRH